MKKYIIIAVAICLLVPMAVFAHQPRIPTGNQISVQEPEISKAYYSQLKGSPHTYTIVSDKPFALYVNVLVPDIEGQKKDVSAVIVNDGHIESPLAKLDGNKFTWTKFFEPFGYDSYWMGPEYKASVSAGRYDITVSSANNDSKYSIAIGEAENFNFKEVMNALSLIPTLKRDFFNESPAGFIFSPFGWGLVLVMFILSFVFGFLYRLILRRVSRNSVRKVHKNIGTKDRLLRAILGIGLFVLAITTSWNPILLFVSGFVILEAIFSWCGLYAALGKSTCPLN